MVFCFHSLLLSSAASLYPYCVLRPLHRVFPWKAKLGSAFCLSPMSNLGMEGCCEWGKWSHSVLVNQGKVKNVDCANQELICSTGPLCLISNMKSY